MRLSRPRVLLRAVLLLFLAGFLGWRARQTGLAAAEPGQEPGQARVLSAVAAAEWAFCGVALLTAGAVGLALRGRTRKKPLDLREPTGGA